MPIPDGTVASVGFTLADIRRWPKFVWKVDMATGYKIYNRRSSKHSSDWKLKSNERANIFKSYLFRHVKAMIFDSTSVTIGRSIANRSGWMMFFVIVDHPGNQGDSKRNTPNRRDVDTKRSFMEDTRYIAATCYEEDDVMATFKCSLRFDFHFQVVINRPASTSAGDQRTAGSSIWDTSDLWFVNCRQSIWKWNMQTSFMSPYSLWRARLERWTLYFNYLQNLNCSRSTYPARHFFALSIVFSVLWLRCCQIDTITTL